MAVVSYLTTLGFLMMSVSLSRHISHDLQSDGHLEVDIGLVVNLNWEPVLLLHQKGHSKNLSTVAFKDCSS